MKGLRHPVQIGVEHDGAVVHDPPLLQILGVAGEFLPVDGHVIPPVDLSGDAQRRQRRHHRLTEQLEVDRLHVAGIGDEREIQVAHVVVHRPTAGQPPYHPHTVLADELLVDLGSGVLVLADNDGVVILPQHEIGAIPGQRVKHVLFRRQIPRGIGGIEVQIREFRLRHGDSPYVNSQTGPVEPRITSVGWHCT